MFYNILFMFVFLFCVCIFCFVYSLFLYRFVYFFSFYAVSFLLLYKSADHYHRMETKLQ